jgi:hypothetical protein
LKDHAAHSAAAAPESAYGALLQSIKAGKFAQVRNVNKIDRNDMINIIDAINDLICRRSITSRRSPLQAAPLGLRQPLRMLQMSSTCRRAPSGAAGDALR